MCLLVSNKGHYQSKVLVCVSVIGAYTDDSADAVNRPLIVCVYCIPANISVRDIIANLA